MSGKRMKNAYEGINRDGFYAIDDAVKMIDRKSVV